MRIKINSRQTGSRNLMGPKTFPAIWGTYMKLVTKYQITAYMFNVYKNQLSRQTGGRNLMGPKTLPAIWSTYMKLFFLPNIRSLHMNNEINDNIPARTSPGLTRSSFATTRNRVANDICVPRNILRDTPDLSYVQPESSEFGNFVITLP